MNGSFHSSTGRKQKRNNCTRRSLINVVIRKLVPPRWFRVIDLTPDHILHQTPHHTKQLLDKDMIPIDNFPVYGTISVEAAAISCNARRDEDLASLLAFASEAVLSDLPWY